MHGLCNSRLRAVITRGSSHYEEKQQPPNDASRGAILVLFLNQNPLGVMPYSIDAPTPGNVPGQIEEDCAARIGQVEALSEGWSRV